MKTLTEIYQNVSRSDMAKKVFVQFEHKQLLYGELAQQIGRLTSMFREYGIDKGDRVLIATDDEEAVITLVCATLTNGICAINLSPETPTARAKALITKTKPKLIFIDRRIQTLWQLEETTLICIEKSVAGGKTLLDKIKRKNISRKGFHHLLENFPTAEPSLDISEDRPAFIYFTSGTTKDPKGVQITYRSLFAHLGTIRRVFHYDSNSRILNNMALFHVDGMILGPLLALFCAATLHRPCPLDVQHLETLLNTVYREKISHFLTVPTVLSLVDRFSSHNDYFHGDYFKHLVSSAAVLDTNLWQRLEKRFNIRICNMYGLTETVTGGIFCGPDDQIYQLGTIGKPIDMSLCIVDEKMQPVPHGAEGELLLKGDNVFSGYFEAEDLTKAAFHEGWFRTGDLASQDQNGFVCLQGRIDELIISGGFNIHPAEINEALFKHPAIAEVATTGLSASDWQEIVVSAIVLKPNIQVNEKDLIEHCRGLLEPFKVPKRIITLKLLPRGSSGKIVIPELKTLINKTAKPVTTPSNKHNEKDLIQLTAETFNLGTENIRLAHGPAQIAGWDSLGHLNLVTEVEKRFSIILSTREIMKIESLKDLWRLIQLRA